MRYRADQLAIGDLPPTPAPLTDDFVSLTVWMTLVIGILFTLVGVRAGQRWLIFWGALTLLACAWYWIYLFL
jgi:hypothetical protein